MFNLMNQKSVEYFKIPKTPGEIGIEIEMETNKAFRPECVDLETWSIDWDEGSIKGNGAEIVLIQPCSRDEVAPIMNNLRSTIKKSGVGVKNSVRAGIHIHINCQDMTVGEILKFMMCYYPLETAFTDFCGENRQGNLFCLRVRDAMGMINQLYNSVQEKDLYKMRNNDAYKYAALNMQSLFKYGSLEFRAMATTKDFKNVEQWIDIITRIKDYSLKVDSVWDNMTKISGLGPFEWLTEVVGSENAKDLYYPGIEEDMMEDCRNIQMLCNLLSKKGL